MLHCVVRWLRSVLLRCVALRCVGLYCVQLCRVALCCVALRRAVLRCVGLCHTASFSSLRCVVLWYVILDYAIFLILQMWFYNMLLLETKFCQLLYTFREL